MPPAEQRPKFRFASWVGGDRDGHPLVTAGVTCQTLDRLRRGALRVLDRELTCLADALPFSPELFPIPGELLQLLDQPDSLPAEPWSAAVFRMRDRLPHPERKGLAKTSLYGEPVELRDDLLQLSNALRAVKADRLVAIYVDPLVRLVEAIGFHLASLDIRQNSACLNQAMAQLMEAAGVAGANSFPEWPEEKRLTFLEEELAHARPLTHASMPMRDEARETVDTLQVFSESLDREPAGPLGGFIVSMTSSLSDLLLVYALGKKTGLTRRIGEGLACRIPIIPLFETEADLRRSREIMEAFLNHPVIRRSMMVQGERSSIIMLGYSDSNKDSGILAS